jgi:hypothetical protein
VIKYVVIFFWKKAAFQQLDRKEQGVMDMQTDESPSGKLDRRWFERYQSLVSFDLFAWLAHAGPFTTEEQLEWDRLMNRQDEEARTRMASLIAESRDHELSEALGEQCEPHLHYPAIPIETVVQIMGGLEQLCGEILAEEDNRLVRRFYIEAISEQLDTLSMVKATYHGDDGGFERYNRRIFPAPTPHEIDIALASLIQELQRGLQHVATTTISASLLAHLQRLRALPAQEEVQARMEEAAQVQLAQGHERRSHNDQVLIPALALKRFLQQMLREYRLDDWRVSIDPAALATRVDPQIKAILLTKQPVSLTKALQLLSHEIECHVLRAASGERSALALLGIGTAQYFLAEEGLALYHDNAMARAHNPQASEEIHWEGTLATGFACGAQTASGVAIPAHSFRALYLFLEPYYRLHHLLTKRGSTIDAARKNAHRRALDRCLRTFRGAPTLTRPSVCSVKDNCYMRGYLLVKEAIDRHGEGILERLMVGAVALEYMDDLAVLGIVKPAIIPKHVAHDPHVLERIRSFS